MISENGRRHLLTGVCVGLLSLFIVGAASAAPDRMLTGEGGWEDADSILIVDSVNTRNSTISIEGETYLVTPNSRLKDENGDRIGLSAIRGEGNPDGPHLVRITELGATGELSTLEIVPMPLP